MRSPQERRFWTVLAAIAVAGAAAAWWFADRWVPHTGPRAEQAWRGMTRPGPATLSKDKGAAGSTAAAPAPTTQPRKCVQGGTTTYTDQPCPSGSQEAGVDGGAITSVPAQR